MTRPDPATDAASVIVTDGDARAALASVRSLGARGVAVHVLAERRGSLAAASRHAASERVVPNAARDLAGWAQAVELALESLPGALLLPITDLSLSSVLATALGRRGDVIAPPAAACQRVADKYALLEVGADAGFAVPRTTLLERPAQLDALPADHAYPVVLKARRSCWLDAGRWRTGGAHVVRDEAELRRASRDPGLGCGALLQEWVPGHGEGLFALVERGTTRVRFAHRRLREKPPSGGVSVLSESVAPDPALAAAADRLLGELGWHGVAMVELRRRPDGGALLMEVNPRLWGSLQLAIDSGVDFPALLLALTRGEELPAVEPRLGVRTRWLLGDLDHLAIALRRPAMRRMIGRSAGSVVAAFVASFFDGTRLEVLRREDAGPFWRELRDRLPGGPLRLATQLARLAVRRETRADALHEWRRRLGKAPELPAGPIRRVLVVCHGNVCRSPFAAARLAQRIPQLRLESAGLAATPDRPADPTARVVAERRGCPLRAHRARPVEASELAGADLILAMQGRHAAELERRFPGCRQRVRLLGDFLSEPPFALEDPWGLPVAAFERCFERIETAVGRLASQLSERGRLEVRPPTGDPREVGSGAPD